MRAARLSWNGERLRNTCWPDAIKPGDTIGIFAPSHSFDPDEAERGAKLLRSWGFAVKIPETIFKKHRYFAGTDEERLAVMEELMADKSVAALMAVRGGFGCQRLLPFLESRWKNWPAKPILGFSDVTALHLARLKATGIIGYHTPMLVSLGKADPAAELDRHSQEDLKNLLSTNENAARFKKFIGRHAVYWDFTPKDVLRPGHTKGPMIGGNLTLFTALLSSPWLPDLTGAILMLEEIAEPGYKLDRLLTTLRQSPIWSKVAALVFGHFTDCGPRQDISAMLKELAADFPGPVLINAPFGHEARNRVFPVGAMAELEIF